MQFAVALILPHRLYLKRTFTIFLPKEFLPKRFKGLFIATILMNPFAATKASNSRGE